MTAVDASGPLQDLIDWAWGPAGFMLVMTTLAGKYLHPDRKAELAGWLRGQMPEQSWHGTFVEFFDTLFGRKHISLRCFGASAAASLLAVTGIWLLLGELGTADLRIEADVSLGGLLVLALVVNVAADYVSLLETRWLLNKLNRWHTWWQQVGVLLIDLLLSGAIIWAAIELYLASPFYTGERDSMAEVLGLFSIFSILFYSTFLTSVWTWSYIVSTWLLRAASGLRLGHWLDVGAHPVSILGGLIAGITLGGSLLTAQALRADADGLSVADRALCTWFPGQVCLAVARLTPSERAQLDLIEAACVTGLTAECLDRGLQRWEIEPDKALRMWTAACAGGDARGCANLGLLYERGLGVEANPVRAADLYRQGCEGGNAEGCTDLGFLYRQGLGIEANPERAAGLYRQGCEGGHALGCTNLGFLYHQGLGVEANPARAADLYRQGCEGDNAGGCTNLGLLYEKGLGVETDPGRAADFYRQGCEGGNAEGCNNLGLLYERGLGVEADPVRATDLYRQACEGGNDNGCRALERLTTATP